MGASQEYQAMAFLPDDKISEADRAWRKWMSAKLVLTPFWQRTL
jgi:hypothetical protein